MSMFEMMFWNNNNTVESIIDLSQGRLSAKSMHNADLSTTVVVWGNTRGCLGIFALTLFLFPALFTACIVYIQTNRQHGLVLGMS